MTRTTTRVALLAMVLGLITATATAWGPRAMNSIAVMAMQVIKDDFPNTFRPAGVTGPYYERDVMLGAVDGPKALEGLVPLGSETEAIQAIGTEIQLLRDVRRYGPSSYYAYRMGVLASLVADVITPYGFAWTPEDESIQKQVNADIDAHLDSYGFTPTQKRREYIRDVKDYFASRRAFYDDDTRLIRQDYVSGRGYNGFLKDGGPAYFTRSVEAIADAWYTVLRREGDVSDSPASRRALTWYFVREIQYLLQVKQNIQQADKTYENFASLNSDSPEAYEKIGDLYYAFGTAEGISRGVREWRTAFTMGGAARNTVAKKLSDHYMREGQAFLANAASKSTAKETDLPAALNSFEEALDYQPTSQEAADLIQKTNVAIKERTERLDLVNKIIASGETVQEQAEKARLNGDYGNAIKTYTQAIVIFDAVDDEFKDQFNTAKESIRTLRKNITDVINEVIDRASDAIAEGDRAKDENRFEEAIGAYNKVPGVVAVIPDDVNPSLAKSKQDLIDMATKKIEEAKVAKLRYEEAQRQNAEAAKLRK